jgi:hypothetical protein
MFKESFLMSLLYQKGASPADINVVDDNPRQLYRPKRKLRISSASALDTSRSSRWSRIESDSNLKLPCRSGLSPLQKSRNMECGHQRIGSSDISLVLSCKSKWEDQFRPESSQPLGPLPNARWHTFEHVPEGNKAGPLVN